MQTSPVHILPTDSFSRKQLGVLIVCFSAALIDGFDIMLVPYTAPAIDTEWGLSSGKIGLLFSSGLFGMALGAMSLGFLADIHGRRIAASGALLVAGVTTLLGAFTGTIEQLIVLRFLAGVGLGLLLAPLASLVAEFSPLNHRNLMVAISTACVSIGGVVGGLVSAAVISEFGWRAIYLYGGLTTALGGLAFYFLVPESLSYIARKDPERGLERINRILRNLGHDTIQALPSIESGAQESTKVGSLLTLSRRNVTLLAWAAFFLSFAVVYFIASWMPKILVGGGLSQEAAIRGTVMTTLGGIVGTMLVGWLSRWWTLNKCIVVTFLFGVVALACFSLLIKTVSSQPVFLLWSVLFALGLTITGGFSNLYTVAVIIYPPQIRSTGVSWCVGLGRFGAVISPLLAGWLVTKGVVQSQLFIIAILPTLLAALMVWAIRLKQMD